MKKIKLRKNDSFVYVNKFISGESNSFSYINGIDLIITDMAMEALKDFKSTKLLEEEYYPIELVYADIVETNITSLDNGILIVLSIAFLLEDVSAS